MTTPHNPMQRTRPGYMAMQRGPRPAAFALAPGEGPGINIGGLPGIMKLEPRRCGDVLAVTEVVPPGYLVRAHRHDRVAQWSFVISGALRFWVDGELYTVGGGGLIWRPAGLTHAVWNPGPGPAVQLEVNMPGTQQLEFYERYGALAGAGDLAAGTVEELAAQLGTFYDDLVTADLEAAHNVTAGGGPRP